MERNMEVPQKTKNRTTIPLLGIYSKEYTPGYHGATCTPEFIAALFTIAKLWKQPRCSTTDEWIKKMRYMYTMEFYSAIKKNDIMLLAGKWMELENLMLSEISRAKENQRSHVFSHMWKLDLKVQCIYRNIYDHIYIYIYIYIYMYIYIYI
jgi:hypothetical protein